MSRLRIAVFGGGHLGTIHAKLLAQVPSAELVAIVEPSPARADELRKGFSCQVVTDVETAANESDFDAAIIASPTSLHHGLGIDLLRRGVHCLVEKPLASTASECRELVEVAKRRSAILQVGHVERFNPAWTTIADRMSTPRFIEATREGSLTFRSMDGGAVLDLMIHDIDLVLSVVKSPIVSVQSETFNWTGDAEDIAHAWLNFANGTVARLSASRVSCEPKRQMRIHGDDWFGEVDFAAGTCRMVNGPTRRDWQTRNYSTDERKHLMETLFESVLTKQDLSVPEANAILDEQRDFVTSIETGTSPIVTGYDGLIAVELAQEVIRNGRQHMPIQPYRKAG